MSVLKKPHGDNIVAKYGPYFTVERIQRFNVGERYEILSIDERWYHVEVEEFSPDSLMATLHFPHWQRRFDYRGSLRNVYMAEIGTYSSVNSHNKYIEQNSGQKPDRKPIVKDKSKPISSYEEKTKYDANFFSKPRPSWAKKRRAPSQEPGDDGNNSGGSDGNYFNVNEESSSFGSNGLSTQRKDQRRSNSPPELSEKKENVEKERQLISNGHHDGNDNKHRRVNFNEEQLARPRHVLFEIQMETEEEVTETKDVASIGSDRKQPSSELDVQEVNSQPQVDITTTVNGYIQNIVEKVASESLSLAAVSSSGSSNAKQVDWAGEMLREFDFDTDKAVCQSLQVKLNAMLTDTSNSALLTKKSKSAMKKVEQLLKVRQLVDESLEILLQREKLNTNS